MDDPWADAPASPLPKNEQRFGNVSNVSDNENVNDFSRYSLPKSPSVNGIEKVQEEQTQEKTKVKTEMESSREEINGASDSEEAQVAEVQSSPAQESHQWLSPQAEAPDQVEKEESEEEEDDGEDDQDDFNDFNDFGDPGSSSFPTPNPNVDRGGMPGEGGDYDDGFGDFADFEEGEFDEPVGAEIGVGGNGLVEEPEPIKERWHALELRPPPPKSEIANQLSSILSPLFLHQDSLSNEAIRMVGGLKQVLVSQSSRDAYAQLTTPPLTKPLDWTRSRVRREHLISMGVPVNLDEVDSHRLSALPPLRIVTSSASGSSRPQPRRAETLDAYKGVKYTSDQKGKGRDTDGLMSAGLGTGVGYVEGDVNGGETGKYGLGEKPEMDTPRAEELCGLEEDALSLLPIASLRKLQADLVENTSQVSATLAWMLQLKDAQLHDSATYNGMISSLIANAARVKASQNTGGGGVFRRGSSKRPQSVSGGMTPKRTGSPGVW
ncbi:hypothetical protein J008_00512 [Cryptococcus neoformans]|nr:hypothetical protein J008_00512 [Cryptococcus neoformans var. grubii]